MTPIKAVHFTGLRTRVDSLRVAWGLARFAWTDLVLNAGRDGGQARASARPAIGARGSVQGGRPVGATVDRRRPGSGNHTYPDGNT